MPKSKEQAKQVLIVVRPAKRGFIVGAAGSDNLYPCMDAASIGEAVIEILEDPEQESMEFEAEPAAPKAEPRARRQAAPSAPEAQDEEDDEHRDEGGQREGWTPGDELMVSLLGQAAQKLRGISGWRKN